MRIAKRLLALSSAVLAALLVLAPGAFAADGVGLWGRADDKVVTLFGFAIMAFFTILVITLSLIQIRLENRRERIQRDLERLRR
jgi:uncharacterized membrane protein YbhN (UPF0104 family)